MAKKDKIYDDIKQIYMFPTQIAHETLKRYLANQYKLPEIDIKAIIIEYLIAKNGANGHDLDTLLALISSIVQKNGLDIPEYVSVSSDKKIKEAMTILEEFRFPDKNNQKVEEIKITNSAQNASIRKDSVWIEDKPLSREKITKSDEKHSAPTYSQEINLQASEPTGKRQGKGKKQ